MFGSVGGGELLFILLLALVFLGPRRLPEIGRMLGKAAGEFRKATMEFRRGVEKEIDLAPVRDATRQIAQARQELTDLARAPVRALTAELEAEKAALREQVSVASPAEQTAPRPAEPSAPLPAEQSAARPDQPSPRPAEQPAPPDSSPPSAPPAPDGGSQPGR